MFNRGLPVQQRLTNNVMEKNDMIQCRSSVVNTGAEGDDLVNVCRAPAAVAVVRVSITDTFDIKV